MSEHVDGPPCEHVPDGRIMVVPGRPDRDWLAVKCPCCGMRAWNEPGEPLDGGDPCPYCDQFPVLVHVPAEQAQPSGYTPPPVGAPTWSHAYGATISERGDRLVIEWPDGRGMSWVAPKVIEGWVEQVNELRAERDAVRGALRKSVDDQIQINVQRGELRAERDRLRAAVAKVRRGEPLSEAELALAEVAW